MGRLLMTIALVGFAGQAWAQADMAAPEVSCTEFTGMTPDEQTIALQDAAAAASTEAAAVAEQEIDQEIQEAVVAACAEDGDLTVIGALEQASAN